MLDWTKAAERYEDSAAKAVIAAEEAAAKVTSEKAAEQPKPTLSEPPRPDLQSFLYSEEGIAAMRLLKAADLYILLAESEPCLSRTTSVRLTGIGLVKSTQRVGMSAAYTREAPKETFIEAAEALALIEEFWNPRRPPLDLMQKIRTELDRIAAAAPKEVE